MHESTLLADLIRQIETVAQAQRARRVVGLTLQLGPLAHISPAHLRHHFNVAAQGTVAEGARLDIEVLTEVTHPQAQDLILRAVELEE